MNNVKCVRHAPLYILHYFPSHTWLPYIIPNGVRMANDSNEKLGIISVEVIFGTLLKQKSTFTVRKYI